MARGGFRGGYGGMNQANMMKQAQKMQQDFLRMQKELEEKEFTAKAGGGMVTAVVNGNREVTKIEIKPEAVDPDDVEMLEDLVIASSRTPSTRRCASTRRPPTPRSTRSPAA